MKHFLFGLFIIAIFVYKSVGKFTDSDKKAFCATLNCENEFKAIVCGIRSEGSGFRLRLFNSECDLLKFGCTVEEKRAYGMIKMDVCNEAFNKKFVANDTIFIGDSTQAEKTEVPCPTQCPSLNGPSERVCGWTQDGAGFRIRLFKNECTLLKINCENNMKFEVINLNMCKDVELTDETQKIKPKIGNTTKPLIVVDVSMFNLNGNINDTVDNFFAATHMNDVPLTQVPADVTRRMRLRTAGVNIVFKPLIQIPEVVNTKDYMYRPTLTTCYHKCPTTCPDEYAPVCGLAGYDAVEPSVVFQNHCYMDAAQCKIQFDENRTTGYFASTAYVESSFVMCLGDALSGVYRFLPMIRTLQHMGRLKKKGNFRYKLRNMRFLSNYLRRDVKILG